MQFVPYLLFVFVTVNCLTMSIVSGKEVCIWEEGKIGDQLYASYEVTKGESNNMKVSIRNVQEVIIYATAGKPHDDFSYAFDEEDRLTLCFSSTIKEDIDISFRYQLGNELKPIRKDLREEFVTTNDVYNLSDKLQLIASEIYVLQDEQRYTREKQHNYKYELNKLGRKIIISCVFETTIMLLCCLLQYFQYRSMIQ